MNYSERAKQLKDGLNFPREAIDIPDEWLVLALTPRHSNLPKNIIQVTGHVDHENIEFLGDAVLELAVSDYIYFNREKVADQTSDHFSKLRVTAVENLNLSRVMGELCRLVNMRNPPARMDNKVCADIFEAIIGAIYIHLRRRGDCNPVQVIQKWLVVDLNIFPKGIDVEKRELVNPMSRLKNLYRNKNLGIPKIIVEKSTNGYIAYVICPEQLNCESWNKYIGVGVSGSENIAKRNATIEAINTLEYTPERSSKFVEPGQAWADIDEPDEAYYQQPIFTS